MIKKLIAALLSLCMALSLCACGDKDSSSKADSSSAPDTTTTTTAPVTTTTTTTTAEPEPEPENILDLEGFEMGEAKTLGGNKDLNLTTLMDCEALSYGDIEAESFEIVKITDKNILLRLSYYAEEKLEGTLDFSEGWDKLNPPDDIWYTGELTPEEVHAECVMNNIDPSGAYYFSEYGHTNATEDRAEIFSAVMRPENFVQFELDRSPFIVAKLNYYAECIRLAFDGSESWSEMPWEKYMDN